MTKRSTESGIGVIACHHNRSTKSSIRQKWLNNSIKIIDSSESILMHCTACSTQGVIRNRSTESSIGLYGLFNPF